MKIYGTILFLLLTGTTLAKENDPDATPPPVLEASPSVSPRNPAVNPAPIAEIVTKNKKKGRGLASVEEPTLANPKFPANGDVIKTKRQGRCPAGYRIADFHGWLCSKL